MSQFEITLPSIRRRNVTSEISTTTETSRMLHFIHKMTDEDTRVKVESLITKYLRYMLIIFLEIE